jgi:serine/threonine protein kinase
MAKKYGNRWETLDAPLLGDGGQAKVFRVRDASGQLEGDFALKRVFNVIRRERFRREIEAIKRLTDPKTGGTHPNIISLIDHSALDESDDSEKQFLVMPLAHGGDLTKPGRRALYKDSIEAVLQVAKQVAIALQIAHQAGVIHRDVKPGNVLFTGNGHDTWLSDFGICLIREAPRITETPEVVGPRDFMAPELEDGGKLEVGPAADVYSLGKLIYYMLTGGVILPRERLHEPHLRKIFEKSERHRLLEILLTQMVCGLERRMESMSSVIEELSKIEDWEKNAQLSPMSPTALEAVQRLQRNSLESTRIAEENKVTKQQESQIRGATQRSVAALLKAELQKAVAYVGNATIACGVRDAAMPGSRPIIQTGAASSYYRPLNGVELIFNDVSTPTCAHALQLFLCELERGNHNSCSQRRHKYPSICLGNRC